MTRRAAATREGILRAAASIVSTQGVPRARVSDIADAAGVSLGSLYRHFEGRADLLGWGSAEALHGLLAGPGPRAETVEQAVLAGMRPGGRRGALVWAQALCLAPFHDGAAEAVHDASVRWAVRVADALGRVPSAAKRTERLALAEQLTCAADGLRQRALSTPGGLTGVLPVLREVLRAALGPALQRASRAERGALERRPLPRRPEVRLQDSARDRALAAAVGLMGEHGVSGFSMGHVGRVAGVSSALLHYHFATRETLVAAALEFVTVRAPSFNFLDPRAHQRGFDMIRSTLQSELVEVEAAVLLNTLWNECAVLAASAEEVAAVHERLRSNWHDGVHAAVVLGIGDGSLLAVADPAVTASALLSYEEGLSLRWLARSLSVTVASRVMDQALEQYRG